LVQTLRGGIHKGDGASGNARHGALRDQLLVLPGEQVFALSGHEVRAVNREQRLALLNVLIRRVGEYLLNPPGKSHLDVGQLRFIYGDIAGDADFIGNRFDLGHAGAHADLLKPLR